MKTFNFKVSTWLGRAAVLCGALLLFAGCQKQFDELSNRIDGVAGDLESLEARVQKLESEVKAQTATLSQLASMQDAIKKLQETTSTHAELLAELAKQGMTIIATDYDKMTDTYSVVLSNGTILSLLVDENAAEVLSVQMGDDGLLYWAVKGELVVGADGKPVPSHVAPQVDVDPETMEIKLSFDGTNWYGTGSYSSAPALFSAVDYDDDYAYFTLADGTELQVALSKPTPEMKVSLEKNKVFVEAGATVDVKVSMKNVAKHLIVKPDGWKVVLAEDVLSVTAPAAGVGENSGFVQIFTVDAVGKSAIYELKVQRGISPIEVKLDVENQTISIIVDDELLNSPDWHGYLFGFDYVGVNAYGEEQTLESIYDYNCATPDLSAVEYGSIIDMPISDIWSAYWFDGFTEGLEYVVWASVCSDEQEVMMEDPFQWWLPPTLQTVYMPESFADLYYTTYSLPSVDVKVLEQGLEDAQISITSNNVDKVYFDINNVTGMSDLEIEAYLESLVMSIRENFEYGGDDTSWVLEKNSYEGSFSDFYYTYWYQRPQPGNSYLVAAFDASKLNDENVLESIKYEVISFSGYTVGDTKAYVEISDIKSTFNAISATITPKRGTEYVARIMDEGQLADMPTDQDKADYILANWSYLAESEESVITNNQSLTPETDYYIVVVAYDKKMNTCVVTEKVSTTAIEFSTESVKYDVLKIGADNVQIKVTASENVAELLYYRATKENIESGSDYVISSLDKVDEDMALDPYSYRSVLVLDENGEATVYLDSMTESYLFVSGVDNDGKPLRTYYDLIDTAAEFNDNFVNDPGANVPVINDVLYSIDRDIYWGIEGTWNRISEVEDITALNSQSGYFKLDMVCPEGLEIDQMWLYTEDELELSGVALSDTKMVMLKGMNMEVSEISNNSYLRKSWYETQEDGYTPIYDENGDLIWHYESKVLYLVYKDVNGKYYPVIPVEVENYLPSATE